MNKEQPPGPLTLEEAEKWLLEVEDTAALARDRAFANEHLVCNLIVQLHENGQLDGDAFIEKLQSTSGLIEGANSRLAVDHVLSELREALCGQQSGWPGPEKGDVH